MNKTPMDYETLPIGIDWYCPNGHQVFTPKLPYSEPPECGSCGAEMSTDSTAFYDVIESIEHREIAEFEKVEEVRAAVPSMNNRKIE